MNKWKAWLGIVLIAASAAGLFFWETSGRETFLTEPVLVAAAEIPAGAVVSAGAFRMERIPKENLAAGALPAEAAGSLLGGCARQTIPENQQIVSEYFVSSDEAMKKDEAVFVIPEEWIAMRSSSLRKGDRITLYGAGTFPRIGTYRVAFVKDQGEQEVTEPEGGIKGEAMERTNSTAQISHLEIVTTLQEYGTIRQTAQSESGLIIVQETENARLQNGEAGGTEAVPEAHVKKGKAGGDNA